MSWIPSLVLMHLIKTNFSFTNFRVAELICNKGVMERCFTTSRITTILQVWSLKGTSRVQFFSGEDPEHTAFDSQATNQIIAEIDFEVNSESHLSHSVGEKDDSSQDANQAQCLRIPETVSAAEGEATLTHARVFSGHGALCVSEQKVSSTIATQSKRLQVSSS